MSLQLTINVTDAEQAAMVAKNAAVNPKGGVAIEDFTTSFITAALDGEVANQNAQQTVAIAAQLAADNLTPQQLSALIQAATTQTTPPIQLPPA